MQHVSCLDRATSLPGPDRCSMQSALCLVRHAVIWHSNPLRPSDSSTGPGITGSGNGAHVLAASSAFMWIYDSKRQPHVKLDTSLHACIEKWRHADPRSICRQQNGDA